MDTSNDMDVLELPVQAPVMQSSFGQQPSQDMQQDNGSPQQEDPLEKLYNGLHKENLYTKSFDEFKKQYNTPETIDKLYNGLVSEKDEEGTPLYTKSKDEFYSQYFGNVKKKDLSDTGENSQNGTQNISPSTLNSASPLSPQVQESDNPFDLAKKVNELSNKTKTVNNSIGGSSFGMGTDNSSTVPDEDAIAQADKIKNKLKENGYDADKLNDEVKDLPESAFNLKGFTKPELLQLRQDNYEHYQRRIASGAWQIGLAQNLDNKLANHEITKEEHDSVLADINGIQSATGTLPYSDARNGVQEEVAIINKYGGDDKDKLLKNLAIDRSKTYGTAYSGGFNDVAKDDPASKYLDNNALVAYHFLHDTNPEKAKEYESLFVDPKKLEGDPDAKAGWEDKMLKLTKIGIGLQQNSTQEQLKDMVHLGNIQGGLTVEQHKTGDDLQLRQQELDHENTEANAKYWSPGYYDRDAAVQELIGQKNTGLTWLLNKTGANVVNTGRSVYDLTTEPFRSEEGSKIYQLQATGEQMQEGGINYLTQKNSSLKDFTMKMAPQLESQVNPIIKDDKLSYQEKYDKLWNLLRDNSDKWGRVPIIGGKVSISPSSLFYSTGNLAAQLVPFMAITAATGGGTLATATAAFATGFHENYQQAIKEGIPNPLGHSIRVTGIQAAALAGADAPQAIRDMLGTKTAVGEIVNKMSDDAIEAALKEKNAAFTAFGKTFKTQPIINAGKALGESVLNSAKEGAKITGFTTAGDIANQTLDNQPVDMERLAKQGLVSILTFATSGGLGGAASRYNKISGIQSDAIVKASQQPDTYIEAAQEQLKNGAITLEQFNTIKTNIEKAAEVSKKVPFIDNNGKPLTPKNRGELMLLKMRENEIKESVKGDAPPVLKEKAKVKLEELQTEINEVYKNKASDDTDTFLIDNKPVSEKEFDERLKNKEDVNYEYNGDEPTRIKALVDFGGTTEKGTTEVDKDNISSQLKTQSNGKETSTNASQAEGRQEGVLENTDTTLPEQKTGGVVSSDLEEHKNNIHTKFRKEFEAKGIPKEQVDGAIALMEARAKSWASEEKGRNANDWYRNIADVKNGEFEPNTDKKFQVEAYHGSPYSFNKFNSDEIGTGEGAQAFGHGLYFTDLKDIAEGYAKKLAQQSGFSIEDLKDYYKKGNIIPSYGGGQDKVISFNEGENGFDWSVNVKGVDNKGNIIGGERTHSTEPKYKDFKKITGREIGNRNLYKVILHEGKEPEQYNWLKWDKKINETQANKLVNALQEQGFNAKKTYLLYDAGFGDKEEIRNENGEHIYSHLSELLGSKKLASDFLLKAGIDGIKYPSESISRGSNSDNARGNNYVVFDDNAVSVKNKIQFQGNKGAVETLKDGRVIIHALDAPDVSTMVHEISHVFENDLTDKEQKIVKEFGGSEPFARGFENYLRDGKAPTVELKNIFNKFKEWLTNIYKTLKGSAIEKRVTPEIKQIFDRLLTEQKTENENIQEPNLKTDEGIGKINESKPTEESSITKADINTGSTKTLEEKIFTLNSLKRSDAKKVYKEVSNLDEPIDAHGIALKYFADGGKISEEGINEISGTVKGVRLNTGERETKSSEVKVRDYAEKNGQSIKQIAHNLWDNLPEEIQKSVSDQDIINELMSVINSHNTRLDAATEYIEKYSPEFVEKKHYEQYLKEHEAEILAEQKVIEKYTEDQFIKDEEIKESDEYINHLIDQYEKENSTTNNELTSSNKGKINSEISSRKGNTETSIENSKINQDALQKRTTTKVLQRKQETTGESGSERERMESSEQWNESAGNNKPPTEEENKTTGEEDPEMTKMANVINDAHIQGKFGTEALDKIINKLQDTDLKNIYEKVKTKIQKGTLDLKNLRERLITTKQGSEEDQAALMYDLANLKGKESELIKEINTENDVTKIKELQKQLADTQNEMMDNALANRSIGRTASSIFRLRQLWVNREMSIVDMQEQYKAAKGIKELTPEQEQKIKETHTQIADLKLKMESAKIELNKALEENARLKEENEKLKELQGKATLRKKADRKIRSDETIQKSNERINKAKDDLKNLRGNLNAGFNPMVAIAIGKIAAEKVYQGVVKFDELVKNILDDVKDIFPNWKEADVINHLLTTKDKNGNLTPSLLSERYLKSKTLVDLSNKELREKVKAYQAAQKEVALKQYDWQKDRRMDMMKNRPLKERIVDSILRWQRFAVLSYPSTFIKLLAVVAHQITLKPLKLGIQKIVSSLTPKSITSKQTIWGAPTWSSLGKYYSAFVRNFALANLKEQFKGIDTKELLYGNKMVYDEFNAAKGLLEMPGRSHGYVKSFIKNPEFAFAHEQQMTYNISKMAEIQEQLKGKNLTEYEQQELKNEYDKYDVTNEDVMERINKLSLEHGKWGILMNDNKFVDKFRKWTGDNGITGALLKSEAPILKIPLNYVGRAFATKYGLIQALLGKGKDKMPSIIRLIFQGTKNLTEEQANLLGRTLTLGSIGAAFFGLGYLSRNQVKTNDDGSISLFGEHLSKNLIHSPEFESFFSGADTGNGFDESKNKSAKDWIKNFFESDIDIAKKNPFTSMLQYGFIPNVAGALISKKNHDTILNKVEDAVYKKVADMTIPGFIKQPASWMDTKEEGIHPMGVPIKRIPKGDELEKFWQTLELGIPGLRQEVPKSKNK